MIPKGLIPVCLISMDLRDCPRKQIEKTVIEYNNQSKLFGKGLTTSRSSIVEQTNQRICRRGSGYIIWSISEWHTTTGHIILNYLSILWNSLIVKWIFISNAHLFLWRNNVRFSKSYCPYDEYNFYLYRFYLSIDYGP